MKKLSLIVALVAALGAGFTGPASAQSSYGGRDALRAQDVQFGFVLQANPEAIKQESDGRYTAAGTAAGGIVGAAVGTQGRSNNYTGGAIGGVLGGLIGGVGAEMIQRREIAGQNILVRLDDGRNAFVLMPLVNGQMFAPGSRVAMASVNGQNRLVSINTPALSMPPVAQPQAQQQHRQYDMNQVQQAQRDPRQVQQEILQALSDLNRP